MGCAPWSSEISSEIFRKSKMGCAPWFSEIPSGIFGKSKMGCAPWLKNFDGKFQSKKCAEPLITALRAELPPEGKPWRRKGFQFLPKKILQAKFYAGKGKPLKEADNFCWIFRWGKWSKGKPWNKTGGFSDGVWSCFSRKQVAPLISPFHGQLPPGGKPWNKEKFKKLQGDFLCRKTIR